MRFVFSDGGRSKYFKGVASDCVVRSIANATGMDYLEIYNRINELAKSERVGKRKKGISSARNGVYKSTYMKFMKEIGWTWVPTMHIGSGCTVHLCSNELPQGRLVVCVSGHNTCVIDGVLYDIYDCSRNETRCVYGYFIKL